MEKHGKKRGGRCRTHPRPKYRTGYEHRRWRESGLPFPLPQAASGARRAAGGFTPGPAGDRSPTGQAQLARERLAGNLEGAHLWYSDASPSTPRVPGGCRCRLTTARSTSGARSTSCWALALPVQTANSKVAQMLYGWFLMAVVPSKTAIQRSESRAETRSMRVRPPDDSEGLTNERHCIRSRLHPSNGQRRPSTRRHSAASGAYTGTDSWSREPGTHPCMPLRP
jgi:hypothetical protein